MSAFQNQYLMLQQLRNRQRVHPNDGTAPWYNAPDGTPIPRVDVSRGRTISPAPNLEQNSMPSSFYANRTPAAIPRPGPETNAIPPSFYANRTAESPKINSMPLSFYQNRTPAIQHAADNLPPTPVRANPMMDAVDGGNAGIVPQQQQSGTVQSNYDPKSVAALRSRLQQIKNERIAAARQGQDVAEYRSAESELRMMLAAQNRARNTLAAQEAENADQGGINRAKLLDAQMVEAQAQAQMSGLEAANNRLRMAQRYNLPGLARQAEDQIYAIVGEQPVSPTYFQDRAAPRDTNAMVKSANDRLAEAQAVGTPMADKIDLRIAQNRAAQESLNQALQQRAIQEAQGGGSDAAYAQILGFTPDTPLTPEMRNLAQRRMMMQTSGMDMQSRAAAEQQTQQASESIVNNNPQMQAVASGFVSDLKAIADSGRYAPNQAVMGINAFWSAYDKMSPDQQQAVLRAVTAAANEAGIDPRMLSKDVYVPNETGDVANILPADLSGQQRNLLAEAMMRRSREMLYGS